MKLYHFDPVSREFTHASDALKNPKSENEFLEQVFTTVDLIPEVNLHQVVVRSSDDSSWIVEEDHRGTAWKIDTKQEIIVSEIGPLPQGVTTLVPKEFDQWNGDSWVKDQDAETKSKIQVSRHDARLMIDKELAKPIEFDGVLFDYNKAAKRSILETIEEAQILAMNDSESTGWRLADNTTRNTSVADLKEIVKVGALRRRAANDQYTAWTETDMQAAFELTL